MLGLQVPVPVAFLEAQHLPSEPWQHAEEALGWIVTWIFRLPDQKRQRWIFSINEAYSRLNGFDVEIELVGVGEEGEPQYRIKRSNNPHKVSYTRETTTREVDYSDVNFLKALEMW